MKIQEKILVILISVLLVMQIIQFNKINRLNNDLNARINEVKSTVYSIQSGVSSGIYSIRNVIETENALTKTVQWYGYNMQNGKVNTGCEVNFNKLEKDAAPYVVYRHRGSIQWTKKELIHNEGLNYTADLLLDPILDYEYQIFVSGEIQQGTNTQYIPKNVYGYSETYTEILGHYDHRQDNSKRRLTIQLHYSTGTLDELQIKNAEILLFSGDEQLDTLEMGSIEDESNRAINEIAVKHYEYATEIVKSGRDILSSTIDFSKYNKNIDKIIINTTYNDGYNIQKQIYPEVFSDKW